MIRYALDTNIVSYFLKGNSIISGKIISETDNGNSIVIPPTVFYEIKRWLLTINSTKKIELFETLCSKSGIGIIDRNILEEASGLFSDLQKKGVAVSDNDILIATYCIHNNITLVSNNEKHFRHITNLKLTNWV